MSDYWVVVLGGDTAWPLNTEPHTLAAARKSRDWQGQGGFAHTCTAVADKDGQWNSAHITTYDAVRRDFVCCECHRPLVLSKGPYTDKAWLGFLAQFPTTPMPA
jgi:hypothetical protein